MADKNLKGPRLKKVSSILTSEEYGKERRTEINRLNRQRARVMEKRVADYLRGMRTLLSGAHKRYKGDCEVYIDDNRKYIVECKCSAHVIQKEPALKLHEFWFPKLEKEAEAMNAVFGVLIIHYYGKSPDYVFISRPDLLYVLKHVDTDLAEIYTELIERSTKQRLSLIHNKSGRPIKIYPLRRKEIDPVKYMGLSLMCVEQYAYDYFVLPIDEFRDLIDNMRANLLSKD